MNPFRVTFHEFWCLFLGAPILGKTFGHLRNCNLTVGILIFINRAKLYSVSFLK